ncbi:MAG TPA: MBL fold metallo-hydrolase [Solirubrobacteraceae bacterium]|jgi:glyoxylase-like metal-dependent hydrolase (beta-lactamase superfamily II)|nr:MBL fold metallo-hydrolase [Solirubrobacteraceae bacterium]
MSALDVRSFTVGPVQENCYIVSDPGLPADAEGLRPAMIVDPGDEPERLLEAIQALGVRIEAILLTHCHFDHIGAVAPIARATGAPVYCPEIERPVLADVMSWVPPGFGPFESYEADHTVAGGEHITPAGLDIKIIFTPGHSPGHVTYAIAPRSTEGGGEQQAAPPQVSLLSGDVLFQGSVGRVDLPGGDWPTLERSIGSLIRGFPPETVVYPGHMGLTTLGRERDTNPFLTELRERVPRAAVASDSTAAHS